MSLVNYEMDGKIYKLYHIQLRAITKGLKEGEELSPGSKRLVIKRAASVEEIVSTRTASPVSRSVSRPVSTDEEDSDDS